MKTPAIYRIARIAVRLGINLNYLFDPVTAWRRGEPWRRNLSAAWDVPRNS